MAYKSRKMRRAAGGKAVRKEHDEHWMNAQGSPEQHEAEEKTDDGFKRGGSHHKRAHGGKVDGEHAKHHLGKRARGGAMKKEEEKEEHRRHGGAVRRARGGESPFSTARASSGPSNKEGSPGEQAPFS